MKRLKVGAFLSSFRLDLKSALKKAQEIGLAGIEFSSLENEVDVEKIDDKQAKELKKMFADHNLAISSVCGDIGGFGITKSKLKSTRCPTNKSSHLL